MASARWRLRRLANIETNLITNEIESSLDDVDREFEDIGREPDADDRLAYVFDVELAGVGAEAGRGLDDAMANEYQLGVASLAEGEFASGNNAQRGNR